MDFDGTKPVPEPTSKRRFKHIKMTCFCLLPPPGTDIWGPLFRGAPQMFGEQAAKIGFFRGGEGVGKI